MGVSEPASSSRCPTTTRRVRGVSDASQADIAQRGAVRRLHRQDPARPARRSPIPGRGGQDEVHYLGCNINVGSNEERRGTYRHWRSGKSGAGFDMLPLSSASAAPTSRRGCAGVRPAERPEREADAMRAARPRARSSQSSRSTAAPTTVASPSTWPGAACPVTWPCTARHHDGAAAQSRGRVGAGAAGRWSPGRSTRKASATPGRSSRWR